MNQTFFRIWGALTLSLVAGSGCSSSEGTSGDATNESATTSASVTTTGMGGGPGTTQGAAASGSTTTGSTTDATGAATATTTGATQTGSVSTTGVGGGTVGSGGSVSSVSTTGVGGASGIGGSTSTGGTSDTVTRSASSYTFQHYPIETNADGVWNGPTSPNPQATSTTFDTVVLENAYLKVTLLPEYGGRILSILHKPTNRELLYQNPLGTPYLMLEDIFYYDYLVILGGIFPSFPEPEHGKYWNQPYELEVISESPEAITVRMSRQDDRDLVQGVPSQYTVGRTDVLVQVDVTLRAGSASLDVDTTLTNTKSSAVPEFEYWTVTTLAPGSPPGDTSIPLNTRILADMDQVHLLESSWAWFGDAETRVNGEVFEWNNLSYFENWVDQGTAFANPSYSANWSGLVNYDNDMGIVQVTDGGQIQGLKLWTFGKGSLGIDLNDPDEWLRPTIEMWHGVTPEFWDRGALAAGEVKQWSDSYFATLGLREVTAASVYGAVQLSSSTGGTDTVLEATATLTLPDQTVKATLRLNGNVVAEQDVVVAAADPTTVTATVPTSDASPGAVFEAEFTLGDTSLLSGQTTLP